jgi:hypothetical protein
MAFVDTVDSVTSETFDRPHLPEGPIAVQRAAGDVGDELLQLTLTTR